MPVWWPSLFAIVALSFGAIMLNPPPPDPDSPIRLSPQFKVDGIGGSKYRMFVGQLYAAGCLELVQTFDAERFGSRTLPDLPSDPRRPVPYALFKIVSPPPPHCGSQ